MQKVAYVRTFCPSAVAFCTGVRKFYLFLCGFYIGTFSEIERCVSVFSRYILITVTLREFQIHVPGFSLFCLPACLGLILINVLSSPLIPSLVRPSCLPCRLLLFVFVFTLYNFQIRMCSYSVTAWYNCKRVSKKYCGILMPMYSSFSLSYYSLYCVLVQRIHIHQSHTHTVTLQFFIIIYIRQLCWMIQHLPYLLASLWICQLGKCIYLVMCCVRLYKNGKRKTPGLDRKN